MSDIQISTKSAKDYMTSKRHFKYGQTPTERQQAAVETVAHKADDITYELKHAIDHLQSAMTSTTPAGQKFHFEHSYKHLNNAAIHSSDLTDHIKHNPHFATAMARLNGQL